MPVFFAESDSSDPRSIHSVAAALALYRDDDLAKGENILDNWSLMHIAFRRSPVLQFKRARVGVTDGRSLGELSAAPQFDDLWKKPESAAVLLKLVTKADSRLGGIAVKLGWQYTRYADDLSFSADAEAEPEKTTGYLLSRIRHITQDEGFLINETKTRVLKRSSAMAVTGVIVNRRPGVRRREVRRLRAILHNSTQHGLASQNRAHDPQFEARIRGQIAFVQMINPDQSLPLLAALNSISG
jgi:hypothetical protein